MICTGQSERSLYTCSARVGEIWPNLFAEGAAIGSPDYFALCLITLQRGAIRGLVAGWDSGIRPCLFQQKLDYKKSGRVRSLGRTSFAFITIVKGPGQKEVAREWKILRSWSECQFKNLLRCSHQYTVLHLLRKEHGQWRDLQINIKYWEINR